MKKQILLSILWIALAAAFVQTVFAQESFKAVPFLETNENLWGMDWLPGGEMIVTAKNGKIYLVDAGKKMKEITGGPESVMRGQGGLLDVQLHPDFKENKFVYFTYASNAGEGSGANTAIARGRLEGTEIKNLTVLYKAEPNTNAGQHFGSRIAFDASGHVYFSVGDRGNRDVNPQDISRDGGKIYRLMDDGSIPADNPFVNTANARKAVYSYGHRNPQGMAVHPFTGEIWAHEHGPRGGDEVNIIKPGANYGWPILSYGINYNGTPFAEGTEREGMEPPATYWDPSIAPSGMAFITSGLYGDWKGHLLVGSLKFGYAVLCRLEGNTVTEKEIVLENTGRIRDVRQGPDGRIYLSVEGKGIYRVE